MFESLIRSLQSLEQAELQIQATGEYPDKRRTEVAAVAMYQNDGTDRGIRPAKFVERAERKHNRWGNAWAQSVWQYINGDRFAIDQLGMKIAYDISVVCDRIKTGRLKKSFRPNVSMHGGL